MRIGQIAAELGITSSRIRFYESRGLIPAPARTRSGYRDYSPEVARTLSFIVSGQALGFTLTELAAALKTGDKSGPCLEAIHAGLRKKREDLDRLILQAYERRLNIDVAIADLETCGVPDERSFPRRRSRSRL